MLPRRSVEVSEYYVKSVVNQYDEIMKNKFIHANNLQQHSDTTVILNSNHSVDIHYNNLEQFHTDIIACQNAYEMLANTPLSMYDINYRRNIEARDLYGKDIYLLLYIHKYIDILMFLLNTVFLCNGCNIDFLFISENRAFFSN